MQSVQNRKPTPKRVRVEEDEEEVERREELERDGFESDARFWYECHLKNGVGFPVAKTPLEKRYVAFLRDGVYLKR